ncbi:MAG: class I SAM-dependent methyltransferase [Gammaproteobacteria bacterium]
MIDGIKPIPGSPFERTLEVTYSLYNRWTPEPEVGWRVDWRERHGHIEDLRADHRHCPAVGRRETLGITLFMPYSLRLYRDGTIEVRYLWGPEDGRPLRYTPHQGKSKIVRRRGGGFADFPACLIPLPAPLERQMHLGLFLLGDVRLNTWIIDSGVFLRGVPPDYTALITPLPNEDYPPTYSISQGAAESLARFMGHLKIPVDFHFDALPQTDDFIEVPRGTPMIQWTIVKLPEVRLRRVDAPDVIAVPDQNGEHVMISSEYRDALSSWARLPHDGDGKTFTVNRGFYDMETDLHVDEVGFLRGLLGDVPSGDGVGTKAVDLRMLRLRGLLAPRRPDPPPPDAVDSWRWVSPSTAWNEVYASGRFHRLNTSEISSELDQLLTSSMGELQGASVLDVGCGAGGEVKWMRGRGIKAVGLDVSWLALDLAMHGDDPDRTVPAAGRPPLLTADVCTIPFCGDAFDLVTDRACFLHLGTTERAKYVAEVARVLRPGGLLYLRGIYTDVPEPDYILPTMPNWICNYCSPFNPEVIEKEFGLRFDTLAVDLTELRGDQSSYPGVVALLCRRGAAPRLPSLTDVVGKRRRTPTDYLRGAPVHEPETKVTELR